MLKKWKIDDRVRHVDTLSIGTVAETYTGAKLHNGGYLIVRWDDADLYSAEIRPSVFYINGGQIEKIESSPLPVCQACNQGYDPHDMHTCPQAQIAPAARDEDPVQDSCPTKPSNPKDVIGSRKIDMGLVPDTLAICAATALLEGALKYGRYNWRVAGVRASIYHAALRRHLAKWWNGQDLDEMTKVHHLDNAIACLAILRDAELYGQLNDDRPPCPFPDLMARMIDLCVEDVRHLKEVFADQKPHQYTIADTPR